MSAISSDRSVNNRVGLTQQLQHPFAAILSGVVGGGREIQQSSAAEIPHGSV